MPLRLERRKESVLAAVLLECASMHGLKNWSRSATEMLEELSVEVPPTVRALSGWPHSPRMFTDEVRRIAPQLGTRGISVKFTTPERRGHATCWSLQPADRVRSRRPERGRTLATG
jgi:hypothetical protein